jgi:chromosome segregation ATPase|tara:strand:+ start:147 stop:521 length:375 start_codon:yes stop_codon:yes gene_type:complete
MKDDRGDLDLTKQIEVLTQKVHDAELETSLVKAVGMNSPEMKKAKERIAELEEGLANALAVNESHQKINGKLQMKLTELEEFNIKVRQEITVKEQEILEIHADNKKLAQQVDDSVARLRKNGII